jgi:hypothetical protein
MLKTDDEVTGARESHPRALAEPDARLSPHPAPMRIAELAPLLPPFLVPSS